MAGRYGSATGATVAGVLDLLRRHQSLTLEETDRLDGRTAVITGANSGLGRAVAWHLAARGARVIMAGRTLDEEARAEIAGAAPGAVVEMERVDLARLDSVRAFCARMAERAERFDVLVLNAGVVPRGSRATGDGFEESFQVNYLANFLLVRELLASRVIASRPAGERSAGSGEPTDGSARRDSVAESSMVDADAAGASIGRDSTGENGARIEASGPRKPPVFTPRIVFVSSEAHRSAAPIDWPQLGAFRNYGISGTVAEYGRVKLLLTTFAAELSRRLTTDGRPRVAVHALCPGAVNTGIAREAPLWTQPLLRGVFGLFFRAPKRAALPVVYLACTAALEGRTGVYLHVDREKPISELAADPHNGAALWRESERLLSLDTETAPPEAGTPRRRDQRTAPVTAEPVA